MNRGLISDAITRSDILGIRIPNIVIERIAGEAIARSGKVDVDSVFDIYLKEINSMLSRRKKLALMIFGMTIIVASAAYLSLAFLIPGALSLAFGFLVRRDVEYMGLNIYELQKLHTNGLVTKHMAFIKNVESRDTGDVVSSFVHEQKTKRGVFALHYYIAKEIDRQLHRKTVRKSEFNTSAA